MGDQKKILPLAQQLLDQARLGLLEGKYGHHAQVMSPGCSRGNYASDLPVNRFTSGKRRPLANPRTLASNLKEAVETLRDKERRRTANPPPTTSDSNPHESKGILGHQDEKSKADAEVRHGKKRKHLGVSMPLTASKHAEESVAGDRKRRRRSTEEVVDSGTLEGGVHLTHGERLDDSNDTSAQLNVKQGNKRTHSEIDPPVDEFEEAVQEAWAALERDEKRRKLDEQGHAVSSTEQSRLLNSPNATAAVDDGRPPQEPKDKATMPSAPLDMAALDKIAEHTSFHTIGNVKPSVKSSSESKERPEKLEGIGAMQPAATQLKRKRKDDPSTSSDEKASVENTGSKRRKILAKRETGGRSREAKDVGKGNVFEKSLMYESSNGKSDYRYPDPDPQMKFDSKLSAADSGQSASAIPSMAHKDISSSLDPRIDQQSSTVSALSKQKSPTATNGVQSFATKSLPKSSTGDFAIPGLFSDAIHPNNDGIVRGQDNISGTFSQQDPSVIKADESTVKSSSNDTNSSKNTLQMPPLTPPDTPPSSSPFNRSSNGANPPRGPLSFRNFMNQYASAAAAELEEDDKWLVESELDAAFGLDGPFNLDAQTALEDKLLCYTDLSVPPDGASEKYKQYFQTRKTRAQVMKTDALLRTKREATLMASRKSAEPIARGIGHEVVAKVFANVSCLPNHSPGSKLNSITQGPDIAEKHHIKFMVDTQYTNEYYRPYGSPLKRYANRLEKTNSCKAFTPGFKGFSNEGPASCVSVGRAPLVELLTEP